ncbi:hypothetical protein J4422_04455 [Candidatus Pacearchaeota archaeon]|nr:hypothetical protein [Candidatus Pacearchaeota archaeon]
MGIFDFLRKITQGKKTPESGKEKIVFSELGSWAEIRIKDIEKQEEDVFSLIKGKTDVFSKEIRERIKAIENFNVSQIKAEDRIKSAVEEGRKKYIESVEALVENLNNMKSDKLENIISYSDKVFSDFNKRSRLSYERATILIGKEMAEIRESLKSFSKDLIKIFDENKSLAESSKTIYFIKLKLRQVDRLEEEIEKINAEIFYLEKEITNVEKENTEILQEIGEIKKSPEHLEILKLQEKVSALKNELEKDIFSLGQTIDFRALGNFYHIFEDKMEILKLHRDDFKANFHKDDGKSIIALLEGAKLNNKSIPEKLDQINKKKSKALELEIELESEKNKDKTSELYSRSTKMVFEIENLKDKKARGEKRLGKLREEKEKITNEIRENVEKLGAELQ